jgi:integrase/recombinase XerD
VNRDCNVIKRVQTSKGQWRYCPVVLSANGRIKPDVVKVNGREEQHPEGAYCLEWREADSTLCGQGRG